MARMHGKGRGSSGSTRPRNPDLSSVVYSSSEVEDLVEKLANQGMLPAKIGQQLRDRYGVPDVKAVTDKTIRTILDERDIEAKVPEDLRNLMEKALAIRRHLKENKNDVDAKRSLQLAEAKVRRLANYYRGDRLPEDWKYTPEKARLLVQ